jgi:triosephosphate isomerase
VRQKIGAALRADLKPIVCIGETLREREGDNTLPVIERQVREGLAGLSRETVRGLVIAYEPVWAIGTGKTATPEQAEEVHATIRVLLREFAGDTGAEAVRIVYGGSVKADNIDALMAEPNIDGALVGGASLDAATFSRIIAFQ